MIPTLWGALAYFRRSKTFNSLDVGVGLSIFGDSAYPSRAGLQAAFKSPQEAGDPGRIKYGDAMSTARGEVEHYFAQVMNQWRGLSMYPGLMPAKQNVGEYVFCAVFLSNCATCANGGSQISDRFSLPPPTLLEYISYCKSRIRRQVYMNN